MIISILIIQWTQFYYNSLNSYDLVFVNGGLDKIYKIVTLIKDIYELGQQLWDFGRGFIKGRQDATC
ncbi:hypothetical protein ELD05_06455 [Caldicellulosiruptor changbaiensis]|uniref:Uncharacterized protein n=1 Tax=Caldicellulosiruptor changbaiensis TaxID=1222016 RepID=A0A3T0D5X0_9FIRM|nr:hypothetical protein ELD05_06455 [Caldicellulosiruptor changbaiensis]